MKNKIILIFVVLLFAIIGIGSSSSNDEKEESIILTEEEIQEEEIISLPTINESVIFEESGIKITAKEIVDDTIWGQALKILIENNSSQDITVTSSAMAINGYMVSDYLYETITASQKSNQEINCFNSDIEEAGIKEIGEIAIWFRLVDPNTYKEIYDAKEPVIIKTSAYDHIDKDIDITGKEIVNQNGIRVVAQYVDENSFWGASVLLYVENNSDKNISLSVDNISVNGFMMTGIYYADVKAGYKSFDSITLLSSELEDNDIEKIENIKLNFRCSDSDSYRKIFETDSIDININ